jgi:cytochrome c5
MRRVTGVLCTMLAAFAAGRAQTHEQAIDERAIALRDAPGRELTSAYCATCHSLDYIEMNAVVLDRAGWEKSVRKMIDRFGAPIPEEDTRRILDYLAENY